jgi:hypothetical protein
MSVVPLHISLIPQDATTVELRYWQDDPRRYILRNLALAEIAELTRKAEADYYTMTAPDLEAIGKRLYRWLDGTDRWLARGLETLRGSTVALAIEGRDGLSHLPWETLHDGITFLVRGVNPAVLPLRWHPQGPPDAGPRNRALQVLFMASSPVGIDPELNFEEEEGRILQATSKYPLALLVEETGNLDELGSLVGGYGEGYFNVLHLTGHADHLPEGPRFVTELPTGGPIWASARDIARALPHRPRLIFLSGCRTGQSLSGGDLPSLAEELLGFGFPAVLGWGRPVLDREAILAAAGLYERLAAGFTPVEAVLHAHRVLEQEKSKHWHLLRFFVAGSLPAAPVTPPRSPGRKNAPPPTNRQRFFGNKANASEMVVDRKDFVGRRRPLQRFIGALRGNEHPAGIVIFGLGGVGKSSLACRLCDRLDEFESVVHVGVLDEPSLLRALERVNSSPEERAFLQGSNEALRHRLRAFLQARHEAGRKKLLLVLDDFEKNMTADGGEPRIHPTAQEVLEALIWALQQVDAVRCLVTSRYKLATSQAHLFDQKELSRLRQAEVDKKQRALQGYREAASDIRDRAVRVADGNPRLMERLDQALRVRDLDHAGLLDRLEQAAKEFREELLLGELLSGLSPAARQILAGALVYELHVPLKAIAALFPDRPEREIQDAVNSAAALGLIEEDHDEPQLGYRVPRLLEPLLKADSPADSSALVVAGARALADLWRDSEHEVTELQALEMIHLSRAAGLADIAGPVTHGLGARWLDQHRYREARSLYEETITAVGRDHRLLGELAHSVLVLGDGQQAHQLLFEGLQTCPEDDVAQRAFLWHHLANVLETRGELDEALRILRKELLPAFERLGDVRERATALGKVGDIQQFPVSAGQQRPSGHWPSVFVNLFPRHDRFPGAVRRGGDEFDQASTSGTPPSALRCPDRRGAGRLRAGARRTAQPRLRAAGHLDGRPGPVLPRGPLPVGLPTAARDPNLRSVSGLQAIPSDTRFRTIFVQYTEVSADETERQWTWITDRIVTEQNVRLIAQGGRARCGA